MTKPNMLDLQTDMKLLLECLDYQKDNPSAMKQALMTLASSLQSCDESKDEFRECGGLQKVLEMVSYTKNPDITEAGLFCLGSAVESNVYSQKLLTNASVFTYLHSVLSELRDGTVRKKQTAAFLLLCLISNNGFGQNLMRQSSCLHDIIALIRTSLPKNTLVHSEWLEGVDGINVELWSTLVSTACVCVNNPQNEENQRICSSLFPYLFSLLQRQTDDRVVKPSLSLLGLTVSNNVQNQDRIRKCGGIDILVKRLESLLKSLQEGSIKLATVIQVLNTIDSCITDNEANSGRFGSLGGVRLVIKMLSECPLNDHDKTQAVLTLAHAVDSCRANHKFINESDGMTVLIQQLTGTEDLELSKTIKYILHICVATGKLEEEETDELSDTERPLSKAEKMKRHNELEILKKINELDSKLKVMEKDTGPKNAGGGTSNEVDHRLGSDLMSPQSEARVPLSAARSTCSSYHAEPLCQQTTPREQTLIDQLVQEKVERQRLELLNKMLQDNMLMKNMLHSKETGSFKNEEHESCANNGPSNRNHTEGEPDSNNSAITRSGKSYHSNTHITETNSLPVHNEVINEGRSREMGNFNIRTRSNSADFNIRTRSNSAGKDSKEKEVHSYETHVLKRNIPSHRESRKESMACQIQTSDIPLDLSAQSKDIDLNNNLVLDLSKHKHAENSTLPYTRSRSLTNRHAEIQCGTPYVVSKEKDAEVDSAKEITHLNTASTRKAVQSNKCKIVEESKFIAVKTPLVVISDINKNKNFQSNSYTQKCDTYISAKKPVANKPISKKAQKLTENDLDCLNSDFDRVSRCSSDKFVKPTLLPPKSKVRVTPRLGSRIAQASSTFVKQDAQKVAASPSCSSICSAFDQELISKLQSKPPITIREPPPPPPVVKPQRRVYVTPVIKSQNNVKKLDKHLADNKHNAAERWNAVPSTPELQGIIPPRPAFSDCGMRRPVLDSPYSVMSVGRLNKPNEDSGFESPNLLRNVSSDTSSVDSNIEGFRSGSDLSDIEEEPISIKKTVLRRAIRKQVRKTAKKSQTISSEKCPETSPNTCPYHRQVRKIERADIQKKKKDCEQRQNKTLMEKMMKKKKIVVKKKKEKSVYEFTTDSNEEYISASVPSESERETFLCLPQRAKLRRRRIPYTDEEEFNLIEGVGRLGRNWNQILHTYKFHPSRTNVDLKDKYKRTMAMGSRASTARSISKGTLRVTPFSMCEERRLRRGVKKHGYNWKTILQSFAFAKGRTTADIRSRWISLHRGKKTGRDQ